MTLLRKTVNEFRLLYAYEKQSNSCKTNFIHLFFIRAIEKQIIKLQNIPYLSINKSLALSSKIPLGGEERILKRERTEEKIDFRSCLSINLETSEKMLFNLFGFFAKIFSWDATRNII